MSHPSLARPGGGEGLPPNRHLGRRWSGGRAPYEERAGLHEVRRPLPDSGGGDMSRTNWVIFFYFNPFKTNTSILLIAHVDLNFQKLTFLVVSARLVYEGVAPAHLK